MAEKQSIIMAEKDLDCFQEDITPEMVEELFSGKSEMCV